MTRVSVGKLTLLPEPMAINQDLTGLVVRDATFLNTTFLFWVIKGCITRIVDAAQGLGVKGVTRQFVADIEIPRPPLEEQERIVAELDGYRRVIEGARQVLANYKPTIKIDPTWPRVKLGEVTLEIKSGFACGTSDDNSAGVPHFRPMNISTDGLLVWVGTKYISEDFFADKSDYLLRAGDVLFNNTNSKELVGKTCLVDREIRAGYSNHLTRIRLDLSKMMPQLLALLLHEKWRKGEFLNLCNKWVGQAGVNNTLLASVEIPLPPLEEQERIAAELDGYRKVIEGARQILAHYKPTFRIDSSWPLVKIGEAPLEIIDGDRGQNYPKKEEFSETGHCLFLNTSNVRRNGFRFNEMQFITKEKDAALRKGKLTRNDVVLTTRGTVGNVALYDRTVPYNHVRINSGMVLLSVDNRKIGPSFLFTLIQTEYMQTQFEQIASGCAQPQLPIRSLVEIVIPLPPLDIQRRIVAELEAERKLVEANRDLIARMEWKLQAKLSEIWGEETIHPVTVDLQTGGKHG